MKWGMQRVLSGLCLILGLACAPAQARDGVLTAIPSDAIGFAVVHNLADTSRSIDVVAKLVQAPALDLLNLAKGKTGLQKGIDESGDLAIVLTSVDPAPKHVVLVPVSNFSDFLVALNVTEPATGIVEVQLAGVPTLVGRKGGYAALAPVANRGDLEQLIASTTNLATDPSLAEWLDTNNASVVVTSRGIKQLLPKLTSGIRIVQAQIGQIGDQGKPAAEALNLYVDLFTAAEREVEQFSVGLHIDSAQTVDVQKRVLFTPGGAWAKWAANMKPTSENLLAGLPAGPFVMAMGGVVPQEAMHQLMKLSVQMMQSQPTFQLTPEQSQKYVELSTSAMRGVQSMRMLVGVAEPGAGLYGNTLAVITVDDSKRYMADYEKSLAALREFAEVVKSPAIPVATTQRIRLGETEALEVSMKLPEMTQLGPPGGPDQQKLMQLLVGADGTLKVYVAPANEHAVVMAYTSVDRLQAALEFYKSNEPGLMGDTNVAKVAAALPSGSQAVAYVSLSGVAKVAQQFATMVPGGRAPAIPDFPDSPPLGMAAKVSPSGAEGHLIVTAESLRAIGEVVAKARAAAPVSSPPQQ